ncbi:MAG: hypothetical protein ACOX52_09705 [Verrucomicrobiota bacterium]|jgi:hypothetical protein
MQKNQQHPSGQGSSTLAVGAEERLQQFALGSVLPRIGWLRTFCYYLKVFRKGELLQAMIADPSDLASPRTFSDGLKLGPETYPYTAKRYTYTYTMMRRVVRVRVRVRRVADQSDHCQNRGRGRNRDRNRFLSWLAPGPLGPLKLRCRVVSAPQQYGCSTRFFMAESHHASLRYLDRMRSRPRSSFAKDLFGRPLAVEQMAVILILQIWSRVAVASGADAAAEALVLVLPITPQRQAGPTEPAFVQGEFFPDIWGSWVG